MIMDEFVYYQNFNYVFRNTKIQLNSNRLSHSTIKLILVNFLS